MNRSRAEAGNAGEAFVAGRLERSGYQIIARNWRTRGGELDIVALDGETLVFVEVRVRSGERTVTEDTVGELKLQTLMRAAEAFIAKHPEHEERVWRVDLVAVMTDASGAIRRYQHYDNLTLE